VDRRRRSYTSRCRRRSGSGSSGIGLSSPVSPPSVLLVLQFCMFLSALFGQKQMEMLMVSAIKNARVVRGQSDD